MKKNLFITFCILPFLSFAQKRKTLANNLSRTYPDIAVVLNDLSLPPKVRAEELTLDQWRQLVRHLSS